MTPEGVRREPAQPDPAAIPDSVEVAPAAGLRRRTMFFLGVAGLAVAAYFGYSGWQRSIDRDQARTALAEAADLTSQDRYGETFALLSEVRALIGDEAEFVELWNTVTLPANLPMTLDGVNVSFRPYDAPDAQWTFLGQTPLEPFRAPRGVVLFRLEKPGHATRLLAAANPGPLLDNVPTERKQALAVKAPSIDLLEEGALPEPKPAPARTRS